MYRSLPTDTREWGVNIIKTFDKYRKEYNSTAKLLDNVGTDGVYIIDEHYDSDVAKFLQNKIMENGKVSVLERKLISSHGASGDDTFDLYKFDEVNEDVNWFISAVYIPIDMDVTFSAFMSTYYPVATIIHVSYGSDIGGCSKTLQENIDESKRIPDISVSNSRISRSDRVINYDRFFDKFDYTPGQEYITIGNIEYKRIVPLHPYIPDYINLRISSTDKYQSLTHVFFEKTWVLSVYKPKPTLTRIFFTNDKEFPLFTCKKLNYYYVNTVITVEKNDTISEFQNYNNFVCKYPYQTKDFMLNSIQNDNLSSIQNNYTSLRLLRRFADVTDKFNK